MTNTLRVFLLFVSFLTAFRAQADLRLFTLDYPPMSFISKGRPDGVVVAVVQEMQRRVRDRTPIRFGNWDQEYKIALEEANVVLFPIKRRPEREKLFKWMCPVTATYWIFLKRKESNLKIDSLEDAKKVRAIGLLKGGGSEAIADVEGFKNLVPADKDEINLSRLKAGQIDLWFTDGESFPTYDRSRGAESSEVEIAYYDAKQPDTCLAFSIRTDDALVAQWQRAFQSMLQDGTFDKIQLRYGVPPPAWMPDPQVRFWTDR